MISHKACLPSGGINNKNIEMSRLEVFLFFSWILAINIIQVSYFLKNNCKEVESMKSPMMGYFSYLDHSGIKDPDFPTLWEGKIKVTKLAGAVPVLS